MSKPMRLTWFFLFCLTLAQPVSAATLFLTTEIYPPYITRSADGSVQGIYIDQIKILMSETGTKYQLAVMPWARAIALARTQEMHCAFATARTAERENQFRWVSPIHKGRSILVARSTATINPASLDEATKYRIGTQRGDYTVTLLNSIGFSKIDLGADFSITLNKLKAGRIDLMPMADMTFKSLPTGEFREVLTLTTQQFGLACNKSVPKSLIERLQARLERIIADGRQNKIFARYGLTVD
ncbi:transporter substrate-binding domain-containing protein [Agrobacterium tumefaciens]|uniref:substrate-binding periplasmic protein n=1 Tax=Agrobacterium tumefaciens TaxID=358 RepID=UPI00287D2CB3|nr:transporter substrate-binding domain-containing protein [Agrobacterium tumefaciens]MDS7597647.1 transporter substrate-binding domain-containing protein [Agrobacterium tumefaciens]